MSNGMRQSQVLHVVSKDRTPDRAPTAKIPVSDRRKSKRRASDRPDLGALLLIVVAFASYIGIGWGMGWFQ